jgi:hypothetical protein
MILIIIRKSLFLAFLELGLLIFNTRVESRDHRRLCLPTSSTLLKYLPMTSHPLQWRERFFLMSYKSQSISLVLAFLLSTLFFQRQIA